MASDSQGFRAGYNINKLADESNIENYAYWLGGGDTSNAVLGQYDVQRGGFGRLFIIRMPYFCQMMLPASTKKVKHLIEFANVGIDGIAGYSVDFGSMTVGYAGSTVELPTGSKDDTSSITVKIYDTAAGLIRSYMDYWITGVVDPYLGFSHYNGALECVSGLTHISQAFHTMEAVYCATDPTGNELQYACLLTNMFPKSSDHSAFNFDPGSHELNQLSIEFTANKLMGSQVTNMGKKLLNQFKIIKNYNNYIYTDPLSGKGDVSSGIASIDGVNKTVWDDSTGIRSWRSDNQLGGQILYSDTGGIDPDTVNAFTLAGAGVK